jgi:hypothetical protein
MEVMKLAKLFLKFAAAFGFLSSISLSTGVVNKKTAGRIKV